MEMLITTQPFLPSIIGLWIFHGIHPQIYSSYILVDRINTVQNLEGRFEEAVIAYLFIVNLLPIIIVPVMWYESRKIASILNNWADFEVQKHLSECDGSLM